MTDRSAKTTAAASSPDPADSPWRHLREWAPALLFFFLVLVARSTFADHYHVPSGSMEQALLPGDHVVVDKAAFGWRIPFTRHEVVDGDRARPGDVVIFDSPTDGVRLIKRVVAVGGQRVAVRQGRVFIDGQVLVTGDAPTVERYGDKRIALRLDHGGGPDFGPVDVPAGQVLVLGDHRGNSRDGRVFGFVAEDALYGRARGVFWRAGEGLTWQAL
jgi:signal peptidase I